MIGLDSYSRQVFIYLVPIFIYISLWIDCLFEIRKIAEFPLAFIAGWLQGHWRGFISRNYVVWPTFLLMNVFIALKGSHFWFLSKLEMGQSTFIELQSRPKSAKYQSIWIRNNNFMHYLGCVKRICIFEHSVMTNFNCACPAIQRG